MLYNKSSLFFLKIFKKVRGVLKNVVLLHPLN
jgi:hypothetical protein